MTTIESASSSDAFYDESHCDASCSIFSRYSNSSSSMHHEQLEVFGDALRQLLSVRQGEKQFEDQSTRRSMLGFLTRNQAPSSTVIQMDGWDKKSFLTVDSVVSREEVTGPEKENNVWSSFVALLMVVFSWFVKLDEEQSEELGICESPRNGTKSFRWNWDRIIEFLTIIVAIEIVCVFGLFVTLIVQKYGTIG
jgi:hypothetical protein